MVFWAVGAAVVCIGGLGVAVMALGALVERVIYRLRWVTPFAHWYWHVQRKRKRAAAE